MQDICINLIMLDPLNPRFIGNNDGVTQTEIMRRMLSLQPTKELMNSMKLGLQWVNRIVVRRIDELQESHMNAIPDRDGFEYVVVEGNTRLACLKSETLQAIYGANITIPVLVATKGTLSQEDFESEIQIIQARANVMIVKQWEDIPKFRHIYNMYLSEKRIHPSDTFSSIVDRIKNTTGGKSSEVRTAIERCMIVDKVAEESDSLEEKYWPFVEAFETNKDTRKTIGINDNHEFVFDPDTEDYQKELINKIPEILKDAFNHLNNGKQFRDKYKEIVKTCNGDVELILSEIRDIMNPEIETKSWLPTQGGVTLEAKFGESLNLALKTLQDFPTMADWAQNYKDIIGNIKTIAERQYNALDND